MSIPPGWRACLWGRSIQSVIAPPPLSALKLAGDDDWFLQSLKINLSIIESAMKPKYTERSQCHRQTERQTDRQTEFSVTFLKNTSRVHDPNNQSRFFPFFLICPTSEKKETKKMKGHHQKDSRVSQWLMKPLEDTQKRIGVVYKCQPKIGRAAQRKETWK